jgi:ankyrin repeat protein
MEALLAELHAVSYSICKVAQYMLSRAANGNIYNKNGIPPLHLAIFYGKMNLARRLVVQGADVRGLTLFAVVISKSIYKR